MAVVGVAAEHPNSPEGDFEQDKYSVTRKFKVQTSDKNDGPLVVTAAVGVPREGSYYQFGNELHTLIRCRRISAQRLSEGSLWWEVTAEYSTPSPKEAGKNGTGTDTEGQWQNPLIELAEVATGSEVVQVPVYGIYNVGTGNLDVLKNSAGQVYNPPAMMDQCRLTLTITRNEVITAPHPATALLYQNCTNSDTWWGASAGQARCKTITATRQVKNLPNGQPFAYLKVTYSFLFLATHDLQILDAGEYYSLSMAAPQTPFLDSKGNPTTGLLDGSGGKLASGGTPVFNSFRCYKRQPFAALGLPQGFQSAIQ